MVFVQTPPRYRDYQMAVCAKTRIAKPYVDAL